VTEETDTRRCKKCGASLLPLAHFCPECGGEVEYAATSRDFGKTEVRTPPLNPVGSSAGIGPLGRKPLIVIGTAVAIMLVGIAAALAYKSHATSATDSQAQAATQQPTFGTDQNDLEGYNKVPWGTPISEFNKVQQSASTALTQSNSPFVSNAGPSSDSYQPETTNRFISEGTDAKMVAKIFGVPDAARSIAGVDLSDTNWGLVPKKFQSVKKDDIEYVFYDGKFVMAYSQLNASSYDAVRSDLAKFPQIDTISASWALQQLEENPDRMEIQALVFKRAATNTRIFLIQAIEHMSIGMNSTSVFLIYIPNAYYEAIRGDIFSNQARAVAEAQAKESQKQQPDLQKVQ
jgi:predicted RNA-binding Zn-ribbon protein involved in translation (DUF1610 family)